MLVTVDMICSASISFLIEISSYVSFGIFRSLSATVESFQNYKFYTYIRKWILKQIKRMAIWKQVRDLLGQVSQLVTAKINRLFKNNGLKKKVLLEQTTRSAG